MSGTFNFARAVELWRTARAEPETRWDDLSRAEAAILDHQPASPVEAGQIVEVLLDQGGDPRSDGRDHTALQRLHAFLTAQARLTAPAADPARLGS